MAAVSLPGFSRRAAGAGTGCWHGWSSPGTGPDGTPEASAALLAWWPGFQRAILAQANQRSWVARDLGQQGCTCSSEQPPACARSRAETAALQASKPMGHGPPHHAYGTVTSLLLRPSAACRCVAALRSTDGSLSNDPMAVAQLLAGYWRDVCASQPPDPSALSSLPEVWRS